MGLGSAVIVPLTNPASVPGLMRLGALLAAPDAGTVVPLTVVGEGDSPEAARALVLEAEGQARGHGVEALGLVIHGASVPDAVLEAVEDRDASLVLMGWQGRSTHQNVFGALIDSVVGRSQVPLAVVRVGTAEKVSRVLLPVSADHLLPGGSRGVHLATGISRRAVAGLAVPVLVLRTGDDSDALPDELTALSDRIHHDPRAVDVAVGAAARADDLIVIPVAPTVSGLRSATTHVAWAAPEATLLVAIDVGPRRRERVAEAVGRAGDAPPPRPGPAGPPVPQRLRVEVVCGQEAPDLEALCSALDRVGTVRERESADVDGHRVLRVLIAVEATDSNAALAAAMAALDEAPALRGAEIRYEALAP